ncbi:MAG: response regulator [Proteobacteria bacterium]|nr:response regulator [Pseudomonadota bacterium]
MNVSTSHAVGAEPAAASAGGATGDWKRVYGGLSNVGDVRITLCEPNSQLRMSLRMAFQGIGFRKLSDGDSLRGVETAVEQGEVDLLIWDTSCAGGDVCQLTHDIRHHRLGKNPFLPIITMITDATPANIRKVMESGPDDLVVKPISTGFLFNRIMSIVERKRLFVVTSDYIGPERRNKNRQPQGSSQDSPQIMEVPNPLRDRATGVENTRELQIAIDQATRNLNDRKMSQHAIRISDQVELIVPIYKKGGADESVLTHLDRLQYASEDLARRVNGTSYEFIGELTMAMVDLVGRIKAQHLTPDSKEVDLLPELSRAIKAAFDEDEGAAELAQRISQSIRQR